MENRNCIKCGKVFAYISGYQVCKECRENDELEYKRVREFIRLNPGVTVEQVSKALDVSPQQILRYLKEDRLVATKSDNLMIFCESCGVGIKSGRLCEKCQNRI